MGKKGERPRRLANEDVNTAANDISMNYDAAIDVTAVDSTTTAISIRLSLTCNDSTLFFQKRSITLPEVMNHFQKKTFTFSKKERFVKQIQEKCFLEEAF